MKQKKKRKTKKIFISLNLIITIILLSLITILNVIPLKYLIIIYILCIILNLAFAILLSKRKKKIGIILSIIYMLLSSILIYYLNTTNNFLSYFDKENYRIENYVVLVDKNSNYTKVSDLKNKNLGYVENEITNINKAIEKLNTKVKLESNKYEDYHIVLNDILKDKIQTTIIEESNYNIILDETEEFIDKFKIIDTIKITTKIDNKRKNIDITNNSFNILISGIDNYGDISSVGRSDVNMILTINPETKQVLMTSIPRDYYVQLTNTKGYKDKLTHAGLYGTEMSVSTIEELLDIDINYYFRVNFKTLVNVIDALGGVDTYSKYSFVSYIGNYKFYKGYNHMNGDQALGFARERKSLSGGDISRAENQQAVIDGIIRKLTSFTSITKYNDLIQSLDNTFQTNLTNNDITSLIKMQLNDKSKWNITSNVLKGTGSSEYTYSYKSQKLYVMLPDKESINNSKELIKNVFNNKLLDSSYDGNASNIKNPTQIIEKKNNNKVEEKKEEIKEEKPIDETPIIDKNQDTNIPSIDENLDNEVLDTNNDDTTLNEEEENLNNDTNLEDNKNQEDINNLN